MKEVKNDLLGKEENMVEEPKEEFKEENGAVEIEENKTTKDRTKADKLYRFITIILLLFSLICMISLPFASLILPLKGLYNNIQDAKSYVEVDATYMGYWLGPTESSPQHKIHEIYSYEFEGNLYETNIISTTLARPTFGDTITLRCNKDNPLQIFDMRDVITNINSLVGGILAIVFILTILMYTINWRKLCDKKSIEKIKDRLKFEITKYADELIHKTMLLISLVILPYIGFTHLNNELNYFICVLELLLTVSVVYNFIKHCKTIKLCREFLNKNSNADSEGNSSINEILEEYSHKRTNCIAILFLTLILVTGITILLAGIVVLLEKSGIPILTWYSNIFYT